MMPTHRGELHVCVLGPASAKVSISDGDRVRDLAWLRYLVTRVRIKHL